MNRTLEQWAKDACDTVQFACNLSGIVFACQQCVADLITEAKRQGKGPGWVDKHPICVAWSDKMDDLSRSRGLPPIPGDEHLVDLVPKFAQVMRQLCEESHPLGQGTDWCNRHTRAQAFVPKIVHLTGSREGLNVYRALEACEQIAKGKHPHKPSRSPRP